MRFFLFLCRGVGKDTRGTAFVVYEDIYDAKNAVDHLSGFNVANRYLIVLYYQQAKMTKKFDQVTFFYFPVFDFSVKLSSLTENHLASQQKKQEEELSQMQEKYGVSTNDGE